MGLFEAFADFLSGSVGNNLDNEPEDVRNTKKNLKNLGFFDDETDNEFITKELDSGIKSFQKEKNLKIDGRLFPGGETEREIFKTLEKRNPDDVFGKADDNNGGSVGFGGNVSGVLEIEKPDDDKKTKPFVFVPVPKKKPEFDATRRRVRYGTPPIPNRKPETISPTPKGNEILDFIGKLESSDNYNVIFGNEEKPLTKMTIKEVFKLQKDMIAQGKGSSAVGRYQIRNTTLKETVDKLGIDENTLFDEKLQDQLARSLMERRGFEEYKAGKISAEKLIEGLANEWAALPSNVSNKSRYDGVLNNKALTSFKALKDLLEKP